MKNKSRYLLLKDSTYEIDKRSNNRMSLQLKQNRSNSLRSRLRYNNLKTNSTSLNLTSEMSRIISKSQPMIHSRKSNKRNSQSPYRPFKIKSKIKTQNRNLIYVWEIERKTLNKLVGEVMCQLSGIISLSRSRCLT